MSENVVPYQVPGGPLTADEREALPRYEEAIRESFARAGQALAAIRDGRLYREEFGSFEAYCQGRFGFTRQSADRLIQAANVVQSLPTPIGVNPPANEAQARELAPLLGDPPAMAEAWREATSAPGPVTAAKVREVVRGHVQASMPGVERQELPKPSAPWRPTPGCDACRAIEQTARSHDYVAHDGARPAVIDITPVAVPLVVSEGFGIDDTYDDPEPAAAPEPTPVPKPQLGPVSDGVRGLPTFAYGRRQAGPLTKAAQARSTKKGRGEAP